MRGVALLSEKLSLRVEEANSFIDFSFNSINRALGRGSAAILESPERSWLWKFQQAGELDNDPSWQTTEYCACAHLAARCKRQKLKSNVEELSAAAAECHHLHSAHDWDPVKCQDGSWHYPGSQEAEYSAHLAFTIAVALSWWVVRMGIFPLPIPQQLQPLEAGSRLQWADRRQECYRHELMPQIAQRLCLRPPSQPLPEWFPAEWAAPHAASRTTTQLRQQLEKDLQLQGPKRRFAYTIFNWQEDMVSITGAAPEKFKVSLWRPPEEMRTLRGRRRAEAYRSWLQGQEELKHLVDDLQGRRLVCSCTSSEGCLVEELQKYYLEVKVNEAVPPVYVGQGCPQGKYCSTCWSSPFRPHVDGTPSQCVMKYARWLQSGEHEAVALLGRLQELAGVQLVCDCQAGVPCHAELLVQLANSASTLAKFAQQQLRPQPLYTYYLLSPAAQMFAPVPVRFPQEAFCKAIRKLFPQEWTADWRPPIVEDILNSEPFTIFPQWLDDNDQDSASPLPPAALSTVAKSLRAVTEQNQRGSQQRP